MERKECLFISWFSVCRGSGQAGALQLSHTLGFTKEEKKYKGGLG
jgi:hypothetical protein